MIASLARQLVFQADLLGTAALGDRVNLAAEALLRCRRRCTEIRECQLKGRTRLGLLCEPRVDVPQLLFENVSTAGNRCELRLELSLPLGQSGRRNRQCRSPLLLRIAQRSLGVEQSPLEPTSNRSSLGKHRRKRRLALRKSDGCVRQRRLVPLFRIGVGCAYRRQRVLGTATRRGFLFDALLICRQPFGGKDLLTGKLGGELFFAFGQPCNRVGFSLSEVTDERHGGCLGVSRPLDCQGRLVDLLVNHRAHRLGPRNVDLVLRLPLGQLLFERGSRRTFPADDIGDVALYVGGGGEGGSPVFLSVSNNHLQVS